MKKTLAEIQHEAPIWAAREAARVLNDPDAIRDGGAEADSILLAACPEQSCNRDPRWYGWNELTALGLSEDDGA